MALNCHGCRCYPSNNSLNLIVSTTRFVRIKASEGVSEDGDPEDYTKGTQDSISKISMCNNVSVPIST